MSSPEKNDFLLIAERDVEGDLYLAIGIARLQFWMASTKILILEILANDVASP